MIPRSKILACFYGPVLALCTAFATPVIADQNNAKLASLFDQLARSPNASYAARVELQVWEIWSQHSNPEVTRFMAMGALAMRQGHLETAYQTFDHVVGIAPKFAEGWNKRATVNYMLERFDNSMRDIEQTLALEPRHFGALSGMGLIFDAIGNPKAAADAWEKALGVHPHIQGARQHIENLRHLQKGRPI
jgi:tetratricopeptide (TPR) repeat protein